MLTNRILQMMEKKTIIWVLGNSEMATEFDRLIVMDKGKILAEGPAGEILEREDIMKLLQ